MTGTEHTLLVANRGEIAIRVMRSAARLGWHTIAIFTDLDADAPHVHAADDAVRVASYLDVDAVVAAAVDNGARFVHPGYGFLSERAELAEALESAGVRLVGPSASVMKQMGRKDAARELAVAAGVPVVPRGDAATGPWNGPLLVKAAAGGGGKGMRVVRSVAELEEAMAAARREAASAFGDDTLLVANRGEIALRVIKAAHELGLRTVAVYSDADREAPHVRAADTAVRIGPTPAPESYLKIEAIIEAAKAAFSARKP